MKVLNLMKLGALLFVISLMTVSYSCQKTSEKASEKMIEKAIGNDADVDIDGEKIVIETKDGTITSGGKDKEWPKEISNNVPEFKFGDIINVLEYDLQGTSSWNILYENVPADALDKYKSALESKGFEIESTIKIGTKGTVNAAKGDLIVIIMAGEGEAAISVTTK